MFVGRLEWADAVGGTGCYTGRTAIYRGIR